MAEDEIEAIERDSQAGPRRARLILAMLSIIIFPLLVVSAFVSAGHLNPTMVPFQFFNPFANVTSFHGFNQTIENNRVQNGTFVSPPSTPLPGFVLPSVPYNLFFEVLVVIVLIVSVFGVVLRTALGRRTRTFESMDEQDLEEERIQVAAVLDRTVQNLRTGSNYRDIVLECYKEISAILERESAIEGKMLTAREFQEIVSKKLGLVSPYLSEATGLFELARYSNFEITGMDADRAILCLSKLSELLKQTNPEKKNFPA